MALRTCGDCHGQASDRAKVCPHCGRPLRYKGRWQDSCALWFVAAVCVVILIAILIASSEGC